MSSMAAMADEMIGTTGVDTHVEADEHGVADESQPTVQFKGFMSLKNEEKSSVILCNHLSQLARTAAAFEAVGYGMSEITEAADHLVGYNVFNLRQLLDRQAVFYGERPVWPLDHNEDSRAVALLLRDVLIDMKARVLEATARDNMPPPPLPLEERDQKRGRSRSRRTKSHKKSKHHKRSRSSSSGSASSSSSGSRKRKRNEDVLAVFRGSTFVAFGTDLLPPDNIVMKIGRDNRRWATKGVRDVSRRPLEDFVPSYLGRDLASDARKKAIQARKSSNFLAGPQFMEHWMGYWMSHGIYGLITDQAFCTAITVMTKFVSQKGPAVAIKYFRVLIPYINARISTMAEGEYMTTLDPFITTLNTDLMAEVKAFSGEALQEQRPPGIHKKPYQPPSAVPSTRTKVKPVVAGNSQPLDLPCLAHNTKLGLVCDRQKTGHCKFTHLNTNKPEHLKQWNEAKIAYDLKKPSKGKGKQGKGKGH